MDNAYAVLALNRAVLDEIRESRLRFLKRHAMQVDLRLHTEAAALQLPHRALADVLAMKAQGSAIAVLDGVNVVLEAFGQDLSFVGSRELGFGFGLGPRFGRAHFASERLDAAHCLAEIVGVLVVTHGRVCEAMVYAKQPV